MENDETNNLNRRINLNPNNNNLNNFTGGNNKIKIFVLMNILILMTFCNYCYNQNPPKKENNLLPNFSTSLLYYYENNLIGPKNFPKRLLLRNMVEENNADKKFKKENTLGSYSNYPYSFIRGNNNILLTKLQNSRILYYLKNSKFSCNWESISYNNINEKNKENKNIFKIGKSIKGKGQFVFKDAFELTSGEKALGLIMLNNENEYIDNWIELKSYSMLNNILKYKNSVNNTFKLSGNFKTTMKYGKYFSFLENEAKECYSEINITFPILQEIVSHQIGNNVHKYKLTSINISNFDIIINSGCGFKLSISAKPINEDIENKIMNNKVKLYFILTLISSILYCIGVFFVTKGIKKKEIYSTGINMDSLCLNSVWNMYLCINNVKFSISYSNNYNLFAIIASLCAIKFLLFDMRLLTNYWRALNSTYFNSNDNSFNRIFKMKIRYYLVFYFLFFISFFMLNNLFIDYLYIFCLCFLLWTPTIIYNAINNINFGYPFIYLFACSFDRMIYPFYFRAINNNFFMVSTSKFIISIMLLYVIFSIILLYIQLIKGSRYIFCMKQKEDKYDFYKNKTDLLQFNSDIGNEKCAICLLPFFNDEEGIEVKENTKKIKIKTKVEKIDIDIKNENDDFIENVSDDNNSTRNITLDSNDDDCSCISEDNLMNLNINEIISSNEVKNKKLGTKTKNNSKKFVEEKVINCNNLQNIQDEVFNVKKVYCKNRIKNIFIWLFIENIKNLKKKIKFVFSLIIYYNFFSFYKLPVNREGKLYMLTPCKHVFHTACLEEWFDQKRECPNCRESMEKYL